MIEYLIRLWCVGCREPFRRSSSGLYEELVRRTQQLIQLAEWEGWISDQGQFFCPNCQIQRGVANQPDAEKTVQPLKPRVVH